MAPQRYLGLNGDTHSFIFHAGAGHALSDLCGKLFSRYGNEFCHIHRVAYLMVYMASKE